jgi:hypothetical protein
MFAIPDESCFTYIDGWLVIGSRAAIDEYVTKDALGYTLKEYAAFAGQKNLLSLQPALAVAYFSLTAQKDKLKDYMGKDFIKGLTRHFGEPEYSPAVLYFGKDKGGMTALFDVHTLSLSRTKAPSAGLFDGQTDEKEMGIKYDEIDEFLTTGKTNPQAQEKIERMHARSEHKRIGVRFFPN